MGCDLIGYILVTPDRVSQTRKKKAIKRLNRIYALADEVVKLYQADSDLDFEKVLKPKRMMPLASAMEEVTMLGNDDEADALQNIWLLTKDAEDFVRDLLEVFNGGYRSVMLRDFPGNKKKQIVVTAIESWGDGFEDGSPGRLIEWGYMLGIMKDLGVE